MPSFYAKTAKSVVFIVFPQFKLLDIAGPLQVFTDALQEGKPPYEISVVSLEGGDVATDTILPITTEAANRWLNRDINTFIVAGGQGARPASSDAALLATVKQLAARSERVGSVCTGAFVLAAAGLLNDRRAVTHWESCAELADCYHRVKVEADPIFVQDGKIWTSAGVTAGIDMSLAIVAEDFGKTAALTLARSLVSYIVRPGGQSQFSTLLASQALDSAGRFERLHAWVASNLNADLGVEKLAEAGNMSTRNFVRLYSIETGRSPAKAIETIRLEAARRLLEESNLTVKSVAAKTGFGNEERLRRAMQRHMQIAPSDYRNRFGSTRQNP